MRVMKWAGIKSQTKMSKLKIAVIGLRMYPASYPGVGGNEVRGEVIVNHLLKKNQVTVYTRQWVLEKQKISAKNLLVIPIFTINNKFLDTFLYSFFASVKEAFSINSIIFYEGTGSSFFSFIPKLFGKKIITTFHALEWQRKKWPFLAKAYLKISEVISCQLSDLIIVVTNDMADYVKQNYHKPALVIPYFFEKKQLIKGKYIRKLGLKKDNYLLFLGRIVPEKRVEWLIKAYQELKIAKKLVIAGGKLHDTAYFLKIKKLIQKNKNIIFTDYVFDQDKEELLANCSLLVLPSEVEGYALVVMEALAYSRKILVPNLPVYQQIFHKINLFKSDSYSDFKKSLINVLENKNKSQYELLYKKVFPKQTFFNTYDDLLINFSNKSK